MALLFRRMKGEIPCMREWPDVGQQKVHQLARRKGWVAIKIGLNEQACTYLPVSPLLRHHLRDSMPNRDARLLDLLL